MTGRAARSTRSRLRRFNGAGGRRRSTVRVGDAQFDVLERHLIAVAAHHEVLPADPQQEAEAREQQGAEDHGLRRGARFAQRDVALELLGREALSRRFYRILDLDLSYAIRDRVGRLLTLDGLPLARHRHALWESLGEGDREERSRKNFGRFLKRWDHRHDLPRHGESAELLGDAAVHG